MAARGRGLSVGHLHLRWLNPLSEAIRTITSGFDRVLVPELNQGQLCRRLRAEYLVDARPLNRMQGRPFNKTELMQAIELAIEPAIDEAVTP